MHIAYIVKHHYHVYSVNKSCSIVF